MAGVVADPALFLDQVGDPPRRPQTALVSQNLRPSLQAAFGAPQTFRAQAGLASCSSGPLRRPQSAFPPTGSSSVPRIVDQHRQGGHLRLVHAFAQSFASIWWFIEESAIFAPTIPR